MEHTLSKVYEYIVLKWQEFENQHKDFSIN